MKGNRKQRQADQLGMPVGTARSKLQRNLIWKLLLRAGENRCFHCHEWMVRPSELAITHKQPWFDTDPSLFWDYDNVAFMHPECASEFGDAAKRQGETTVNNLVKIAVLNSEGRPLQHTIHDGKLIVAGVPGSKYKIQIENLVSRRLEIVTTVDGRDVVSSKEGSFSNRGYVLSARETLEIEGWRTSDSTVAAFEFRSDKENAYASQLGAPQNLGVIGVAVFEELVQETKNAGWLSSTSWASGSVGDVTKRGRPQGGVVLRSMSLNSWSSDRAVESPVSDTTVYSTTVSSIGTGFGEDLQSEVSHTRFFRKNTQPDAVHEIGYDTLEGWKARGVVFPVPSTASAFPAESAYCKPPVRR